MSHEEKKKNVGGGLKFLMDKIGLGINGSWDKTEIEESYKKNSNWECNICSFGGSTSGTSITLPPNQEPTFNIDLGTWSSSVDDKHSVLVDVNWDKAYPLYEFVSDPQKKAEIKKSIENYITNKRITILPTSCVYRAHNGIDHFYTTKYSQTYGDEHNWVYECTQFSVYTKKIEGTVPLYQYFGEGDHFYCLDYFPNGIDNRKFEGILGYVYASPTTGTIPLYRYFNNNNKKPDHFYSIYNAQIHYYTFEKIECYVLPND